MPMLPLKRQIITDRWRRGSFSSEHFIMSRDLLGLMPIWAPRSRVMQSNRHLRALCWVVLVVWDVPDGRIEVENPRHLSV